MDFLDPIKRRRHSRRLMIGYLLIGILILLIVRFFVIWASGETINPKTGKITDYGLLFVDSQPHGADIYLNGQRNGSTAARLSLLAGTYDIKISKSGYYDWTNKLNLPGQSVDRITYPLLLPKSPKPVAIKTYSALPETVSASRDRHWLLIGQPPVSGNFSFDLYDTTKPAQPPTALAVPAGLLDNTAAANQALSVVEWAGDNNHMLLKHSYQGGVEFIIFSRADPASNLNLNRQFKIPAASAGLNNGRPDQVYLYNPASQSLSLANIARNTVDTVVQKAVEWKSIGDSLVFYTTTDGAPGGKISFKIWDNGKVYELTDLPTANVEQFDAYSYGSHWYYVVGNGAVGRIIIYQDPLDSLKDPTKNRALPLLSIVAPSPPLVRFSDNGRFIEAQSGQQFNIYDIETKTRYRYNLIITPSPTLNWMDGFRLSGNIDNQVFIMDFDSQNQHKLIPTASGIVKFDGPYTHMYSFGLPSDGVYSLQVTDLRAGADLPKQ